jgi:MscS family membrane protein
MSLYLEDWFWAFVPLAVSLCLFACLKFLSLRVLPSSRFHWLIRPLQPLQRLNWLFGLWFFIELSPLPEGIADVLAEILYVLLLFLVFQLLRIFGTLGLGWWLGQGKRSSRVETGFIPLLRNVVAIVLFTGTLVVGLGHFGYDAMSLMTALGLGSLGLGLAARDILAQVLSGFVLILDENLRPGDRITVQGVTGDIAEIGIRSTQLRTTDGNFLIIPNVELINTRVLSVSLPDSRAVMVQWFRFPLEIPFAKIKDLLLPLAEEHPDRFLGKSCAVLLSSLAEGQQLVQVVIWMEDFTRMGSSQSLFLGRAQLLLLEAGIPMLAPVIPSDKV